MKRILISVEGQTEEQFVKVLLQPHLLARDIHAQPILLVTKRVKNGPSFKGGISKYEQIKRDLRRLLADSDAALITTFYDLYGLPSDVPGYGGVARLGGVTRATALEHAMHQDLGASSRFRPFLMVHEYEAILYCDVAETARVLENPAREAKLAQELGTVASPEDLNDGPTTHPSARICGHFPTYRKRLHGPLVAATMGLETIRQRCAHLADWLRLLETV